MKYTYEQLDQWLLRHEARIAAHRRSTNMSYRIERKIASVTELAAASGDLDRIAMTHDEITKLQKQVADQDYSEKSLAEMEKELDRLYGDQSKNETFYFGKKKADQNLKKASFERIRRYLDENRWTSCLDNRSDVMSVVEGLSSEFGYNARELFYLINKHLSHLCLDIPEDLDEAARMIADQARRGRLAASHMPGNTSDAGYEAQSYQPDGRWYGMNPEPDVDFTAPPLEVGDQSQNDAFYFDRNTREASVDDGYFTLGDLYTWRGIDEPITVDRGAVETFGYDGDSADENPANYHPR